MQTFLPYPNFIGSAKVLDVRRLGKQRVENLQIMQVLLGHRVAHTHHLENTGAYRTAYFNDRGEEVDVQITPEHLIAREESVPVQRFVESPSSTWRIEPVVSKAWRGHPAVLMWQGYEHILLVYQNAICDEWTSRTFKDTCKAKTQFLYSRILPDHEDGYPEWMGNEEFHRSHQSNLLRKHPLYYRQFFHDVPEDLPYFWPVTA